MGSVRVHRERKVLFLDFRHEGRRCREYTALPDTTANRRKLERLLNRIESEIAAGTFDHGATFAKTIPTPAQHAAQTGPEGREPHAPTQRQISVTPTFRACAQAWIEQHRIEWRRSHLAILKCTIDKHLMAHFGDLQVGHITKSDVLAFRSKIAGLAGLGGTTLGNRRINGILQPLRQILSEAAETYGFVSPMNNIKPLKVRKSDVFPFALDQVQTIIAAARADYRDYFTVRFFTGMRTGEVHGLKWKYVDFDRRLILIRETFVLGEDEYTKTDESQRDIQMSQIVFDALKRQHAATGKQEYVFCNRAGRPLDNKNFVHRVWQPLLRHLNLEPRRPYQMRHTAATLWLAAGEAPEWIARQLGHSNTEMLFRVYSRFVPNMTRQDGAAIDRLLATRFPQVTGEDAVPNPVAVHQTLARLALSQHAPHRPT